MIKILSFIGRLKDWQVLIIGVVLIMIGLYLNPFRLADVMTFEEFKIYYNFTVQEQKYHDIVHSIKFCTIAFSGFVSMLLGGGFVGDWFWRKI